MNITAALEGYWLSKKRNLSQNTVNDYALTFRRLVEFLSEKQDFQAITAHQLIDTTKTYLARDLLPATEKGCFKAILLNPPANWATYQLTAAGAVS